jgi:hypothetical protein
MQAEEPGSLGRDAVHRYQLLLLSDRAQEAERVAAEAGQRDHREQGQGERRAGGRVQALA